MSQFNDVYLLPDGWKIGEKLIADDTGYKDSSFPGCEYRLPAGIDYRLAVNITISGRKSHIDPNALGVMYKTRVKIEHVGDGEPSTFNHGFIFTDYPVIN